jgi:hypothetical protein
MLTSCGVHVEMRCKRRVVRAQVWKIGGKGNEIYPCGV